MIDIRIHVLDKILINEISKIISIQSNYEINTNFHRIF